MGVKLDGVGLGGLLSGSAQKVHDRGVDPEANSHDQSDPEDRQEEEVVRVDRVLVQLLLGRRVRQGEDRQHDADGAEHQPPSDHQPVERIAECTSKKEDVARDGRQEHGEEREVEDDGHRHDKGTFRRMR